MFLSCSSSSSFAGDRSFPCGLLRDTICFDSSSSAVIYSESIRDSDSDSVLSNESDWLKRWVFKSMFQRRATVWVLQYGMPNDSEMTKIEKFRLCSPPHVQSSLSSITWLANILNQECCKILFISASQSAWQRKIIRRVGANPAIWISPFCRFRVIWNSMMQDSYCITLKLLSPQNEGARTTTLK